MSLFTKYRKLIGYLTAGILAYSIELGVLYSLLNVLNLGTTVAVGLAYWVGFISAFSLQKAVFGKGRVGTRGHLIRYSIVVGFNYVFTLLFVSLFSEGNVFVARTIALLLTTSWNYGLYNYFIFSKSLDTKSFIRKLAARVSLVYLDIKKRVEVNSKLLLKLAVALSVVGLVLVSAYSAYRSSHAQIFSADEISYTYMLTGGFAKNAFSVLDIHTNILKLPIIFLQSKLGFSLQSFTLFNVGLTVITNLLFVLFFKKIFKKKETLIVTVLTLALIQANSVLLNLNYVFKTFRNIEIPIICLLMFGLFKSLDFIKYRLSLIFYLLAYSLILSGDSYYKYTVSLPLLLVAGILWLRKRLTTAQATIIGSFAVLSILIASVINKLIDLSGLFNIVFGYEGSSYTVPYENLFNQLKLSSHEVIRLFGGDFFGEIVSYRTLAPIVCFTVLFTAVIGGLKVIKGSLKDRPVKEEAMMILVALIPVFTFLVYILSGQSKAQETGARYLVLLPLMGAILFAYWVEGFSAKSLRKGVSVAVICVLSFGVMLGLLNSRVEYGESAVWASAQETYYQEIAEDLKTESVGIVLAGHWTATPIKFWSDKRKQLEVAPIQNCDQPLVFLTNKAWFKPDGSKSALVIDRASDAQFWNCDNAELVSIYGNPEKVLQLREPSQGVTTEIWIYKNDAREKLDTKEYMNLIK